MRRRDSDLANHVAKAWRDNAESTQAEIDRPRAANLAMDAQLTEGKNQLAPAPVDAPPEDRCTHVFPDGTQCGLYRRRHPSTGQAIPGVDRLGLPGHQR